MKISGRIRQFSSVCLAAACLMPWLLTSCSSPAAKNGAAPAAAASAVWPDGYPNLNIPVTTAAPQLTEEERRQLVQELSVAGRVEDGVRPTQSAADAERLRQLARQHAEERLSTIEAAE